MTISLSLRVPSIQSVPKLTNGSDWVGGLSSESNVSSMGSPLEYTSLRDLMVMSPTNKGSPRPTEVEWFDLSQVKLKNKLLKKAARAYLQPVGRQAAPRTHFFSQFWNSISSRNEAIVTTIKGFLQMQVRACLRFLRTQTLNVFQRLKPQQLGFRRVRPNKAA